MSTQQQRPEIKKIMEKDSAIKMLNEIQHLIGGTDLTNICDDEIEIKPDSIQDVTTRRVLQAIQCGLVFWDENQNCLIQKLIRPLKSGEQTASELKYINRMNVKELKGIQAVNELELFEKVLSQVVGRSPHLIGHLTGQDIEIAMGCLSFFGK